MPTVLHSIMMILIGLLLFFKGVHLLCWTDVIKEESTCCIYKKIFLANNILQTHLICASRLFRTNPLCLSSSSKTTQWNFTLAVRSPSIYLLKIVLCSLHLLIRTTFCILFALFFITSLTAV